MAVPRTRYAVTPGGGHVAYQVVGNTGPDIVLVTNWYECIDLMWDEPRIERFLRRLASVGRLVLLDKRGSGASDPGDGADGPYMLSLFEQGAEDVLAVLDAVESSRATVIGTDLGGSVAMLFAATHPERVEKLILQNATARLLPAPDYPSGLDLELVDLIVGNVARGWGTGLSLSAMAPSLVTDRAAVRWFARYERLACPPSVASRQADHAIEYDVRSLVPTLRMPTLVLSHDNCTIVPVGQGRYLADRIPNATYVELSGADAWYFVDPRVADAMVAFLGVPVQSIVEDRVLAAVLFTDLVESTAALSGMGDQRWREVLDTHDRVASRVVDAHRGRLVKHTGDGILAVFDGPGRAVRCATALRDDLAKVGLSSRAGVHVGEVELRGDDVVGIAVHIAARVLAAAGDDEVLVTRTVTDLVTGSESRFEERGEHELKGVPGTWPLFAVSR